MEKRGPSRDWRIESMVAVAIILGEEGKKGGKEGRDGLKVAVMLEEEGGDIVVKCVQRDWKFLWRSLGY